MEACVAPAAFVSEWIGNRNISAIATSGADTNCSCTPLDNVGVLRDFLEESCYCVGAELGCVKSCWRETAERIGNLLRAKRAELRYGLAGNQIGQD
jgi:hypothetical protein